MGRPVYCEFCDYALVGLLEPGAQVTCPECGNLAAGRWLPRRVRVLLAVALAISPMIGLILLSVGTDLLRLTVNGVPWGWAYDTIAAGLGLAGLLFPPAAAWWLWRKSARRRLDFIDIACLVPVGWLLNSFTIVAGIMSVV